MPQFMYITKNGLTIALDTEYLNYKRTEIINMYIDFVNSPDYLNYTDAPIKIPTEQELLSGLNDLCNTAIMIIQGSLNIIDKIPLTKAGTFNKTKTLLVKNTKVKHVFNGDFFSMGVLQLRLVQTPYEFHPVYGYLKDSMKYTGDGRTLYLEMDFYDKYSSKEQALLSAEGTANTIVTTRNKYLKQEEIKKGYIYKDAKGTKYLYLGSERFTSTQFNYFYLKMTKAVESLIQTACCDVATLKKNPACKSALKCVYNPMKFVEEVGKAF